MKKLFVFFAIFILLFSPLASFPVSANIDPDDDNCFVPTIKNTVDLQLIVAGGWGPCTAVCHGWSGGSRAVHGKYQPS